MFCWTPVIRKKRYFIPVLCNFPEMSIGNPFLCQQHEHILEWMRICPLFYLPNTTTKTNQYHEDLHDERPWSVHNKGVTPRIPRGLPSRWSPTRGSNQAELIMQRLCYSLRRSINGTRIHVQIIFGTTNCHSGLPSSVVVWWLSSYVRCTVQSEGWCPLRLRFSSVEFGCLFFVAFLYEKGNGDGQTTTIEMEWNAKLGNGSFSVNTICGLASCIVHVVVVGLFIYDDDCKETLQITTLPFEWIIGY